MPLADECPIPCELRMPSDVPHPLIVLLFESISREPQKVDQHVRIATVHGVFIGKLMLLRLLRNARFEATLDGVASEINSAIVLPAVEQHSRFTQAHICECLKIDPRQLCCELRHKTFGTFITRKRARRT